MNKKSIVIASLMVVIVGPLAWLYFAQSKQEQKIDLDIYQALGSVTAEETAKLIGKKGTVVVITWGFSLPQTPVDEAQTKSFARELKKHPGLRIIAMEKVERNPAQMMASAGAVPAEKFLDIVKAHPKAGAIVLFMAFPHLPEKELKMINDSQTKFVVVSGCNPGYKNLLLSSTIDLAIVPQFDRTSDRPRPQTLRESFDQNFLMVTPDQASRLPY